MLWSPNSALISHLAICVPSPLVTLILYFLGHTSQVLPLGSILSGWSVLHLIVTCFASLLPSGLWPGSLIYWLMPVRILADYYYLRKLICLNISLHHPWVFQIISLFIPIWNYSLHFSSSPLSSAYFRLPKITSLDLEINLEEDSWVFRSLLEPCIWFYIQNFVFFLKENPKICNLWTLQKFISFSI